MTRNALAVMVTMLVIVLVASAASGDERAAHGLRATTDCDDTGAHRPTARLAWDAAPSGEEQRIEVTTAEDGFAVGKMDTSDALAADTTALPWTDLRGRSSHYWRVVTRYGDQWVASETARFTPPRCGERLVLPPILPPSGSARDGADSAIPPSQRW
jgi:hypothetical protein